MPNLHFAEKIVGLDELTFNVSGLAKYFENYHLEKVLDAATYDWAALNEKYPDYKIFIFQAEKGYEEEANKLGITLLQNPYRLRQYLENKVELRKLLASEIRFPEYTVSKAEALLAEVKSAFEKWGGLAIQVPFSEGGEGTAILEEYSEAEIVSFKESFPTTEEFLISKFVPGEVISTQICISKYGPLTTGVNFQAIDDPELTPLWLSKHDRFCGGFLNSQQLSVQTAKQIKEISLSCAEKLKELGYKGIFGIDFIIGADDNVYMLEINPRLTGMSQLIRIAQEHAGQIPLLLIHVLELGGIEYELFENDLAVTALHNLENILSIHKIQGGQLIFRNLDKVAHTYPTLKSGKYRINAAGIELLTETFDLDAQTAADEYLVVSYLEPDLEVAPGQRLFRIFGVTSEVEKLKAAGRVVMRACADQTPL